MKSILTLVIVSALTATTARAADPVVCSSADQRIKIVTNQEALAYEKITNANSQVLVDGVRGIFQETPSLADHLAHTAIYTFWVKARKPITDVNAPISRNSIEDLVVCRDYGY